MPRTDDTASGSGYRLDGVYRWLIDRCADNYDPRRLLEIDASQWEATIPTLPRANPGLAEALQAGQPVELEVWRLGGNTWPEVRGWPCMRPAVFPENPRPPVVGWRVWPDDTVEPIQ